MPINPCTIPNPFDMLANLEKQAMDALNNLKKQLPGGGFPLASLFANLKGGIPNPQTLQDIFSCEGQVPTQFLGKFDFENEMQTLGIPQPNFDIDVQFQPTDLKEIPPIDTTGLTQTEIAEQEAARQKQIERNKKAAQLGDKIKSEAANFANNLFKGDESSYNPIGESPIKIDPNSSMGKVGQRIAAFSYFKNQLNYNLQKLGNIQSSGLGPLVGNMKDQLKAQTDLINNVKSGGITEQFKTVLNTKKETLEGIVNNFNPIPSSHPSMPVPHDGRKISDERLAADRLFGFIQNLCQYEGNLGNFLLEGMFDLKGLLGPLMGALTGIFSALQFINFLKQLLEILTLSYIQCETQTNPTGTTGTALTPEEFLVQIGYPGYGELDISDILNEILINIQPIDPPTFPVDTFIDPNQIIIGGINIGIPPTDPNLDLTQHPLLGDLSGIHPHLINELYQEGYLPKPDDLNLDEINPNSYSDQLDEYYSNLLDEFKNTNQIEWIDKIFNTSFEMIGFRRYFDDEK